MERGLVVGGRGGGTRRGEVLSSHRDKDRVWRRHGRRWVRRLRAARDLRRSCSAALRSVTHLAHTPTRRPPPASRLHQQPCLRQVVEVSLIVHAWLHGETGIRGWAAKVSATPPPSPTPFFPPALCCKCKDTLYVMTSDFCCLLPPPAASPTS